MENKTPETPEEKFIEALKKAAKRYKVDVGAVPVILENGTIGAQIQIRRKAG